MLSEEKQAEELIKVKQNERSSFKEFIATIIASLFYFALSGIWLLFAISFILKEWFNCINIYMKKIIKMVIVEV